MACSKLDMLSTASSMCYKLSALLAIVIIIIQPRGALCKYNQVQVAIYKQDCQRLLKTMHMSLIFDSQ